MAGPKTYKPWTVEHDALLHAYRLQNIPLTKIAKLLDRTYFSVKGRTVVLGLQRRGYERKTSLVLTRDRDSPSNTAIRARLAERDKRLNIVPPLDHYLMGAPLPGSSALDRKRNGSSP